MKNILEKNRRSSGRLAALLLGGIVFLTGCGAVREVRVAAAPGKRLEFWHTRRGDQEQALRGICDEYNRTHPGVTVVPVYQGSYDELNKKLRASILAHAVPALAVAYEPQVAEYAANDALRPLDDLVRDPRIGLTKAELADIPSQYLAANRYVQYRNQLLSFPFTKSNLVLFYNKSLLQKAGLKNPPRTWPEFEQQAAAISKQTGRPAVHWEHDASTLDGIIFSQGGKLLTPDGKRTLFDQPGTVHTLELLQRLQKNRSLVQATGDEGTALVTSQRVAFSFGSSATRATMERLIGNKFDWDVAVIPHADGMKPVTVMYGPNVCIFRSTPDVEREAWSFVKFFVSPAITARWARETGYLPIRTSAASRPEMKAFYAQDPRAQHVYQILSMAKPEPNVVGWQEVRGLLTGASRAVLSGSATPQAAAAELKRKADAVLAQSKVK